MDDTQERWITPEALLGSSSVIAVVFTTAGLVGGGTGLAAAGLLCLIIVVVAFLLRRFAPKLAERMGLRSRADKKSGSAGSDSKAKGRHGSGAGSSGRKGLLGRRKSNSSSGSSKKKPGLLGRARRAAKAAARARKAAAASAARKNQSKGRNSPGGRGRGKGLLGRKSSPKRRGPNSGGKSRPKGRTPSSSNPTKPKKSRGKGLLGGGKGRQWGDGGCLLGGDKDSQGKKNKDRSKRRTPPTGKSTNDQHDTQGPSNNGSNGHRPAARQGANAMPNPFESRQDAISGAAPLEIERARDLIDYVNYAPDYYETQAQRTAAEARAISEQITIVPEFADALNDFAAGQARQVERVRELGAQFRRAHAAKLTKLDESDPKEERWDIGRNRG